MNKCNDCIHKDICKYENEMKKLENEIIEKIKPFEQIGFSVKIECEQYRIMYNSLNNLNTK